MELNVKTFAGRNKQGTQTVEPFAKTLKHSISKLAQEGLKFIHTDKRAPEN